MNIMTEELKSLITLTDEIFDIIKDDYSKYLNNEKQELLDNINYNNLFKIKDNLIYFKIDCFSYPLKKNNLSIEVIIFICLTYICSNINPLKIILIDYEINKIITNNNLERSLEVSDFELIDIIESKILNDLPYNIIFLDSDIEIFNYLRIEKGIKVAKLYYDILLSLGNTDNPLEYYLTYKNFNYEDTYEIIYNYINKKIF